ncbi:MAG: flagellar M-ring protein FliF C-terminal domain-containing protein, partial [Planctomycetota bacterium]|nr:flagellar M-ring protein FliF C-terminal domain-containing protein [Planctomycetota bacterium]
VGIGVLLAVSVAGISAYRSANPHMEFFIGDLDNAEFARATKALGQEGIRFNSSTGTAPYSIFVESSKKYQAHSAVATSGALDMGTMGIDTGGSSSAWESSVERLQKADARYWQEVEQQLSKLHWVRSAKVIARAPTTRILGRTPKPTVSVILNTRGMHPTAEQSQNVGSMVRMAFNVPEENISVLDHLGATIFNGKSNNQLTGNLAFQRAFNQDQTESVQSLLDDIYGPGLTKVRVSGEWSFVQKETVGESVNKGAVISERTQKSKTPTGNHVGGPAGLDQSFGAAPTQPIGGSTGPSPATKDDIEKKFAVGTQTTHQVENSPVLEHLSVSLTLDASLQEQADALTDQVKSAVGFRTERGDLMSTHTTTFVGVERDAEGAPVAAAPIEAPEPPNAMMTTLIERGVELLAVLLFFGLLIRTMKQSKNAGSSDGGSQSRAGGAMTLSDLEDGEIEIDPSILARKHIENLLESDPERVSSLLTRWAMGDQFYAESK